MDFSISFASPKMDYVDLDRVLKLWRVIQKISF
jgi:hypothetical protein